MKKFFTILLVTSMTLMLIITQTGCSEKEIQPVSLSSYYMDTICQIDIYDMENMSEDKAKEAINGAFSLAAEYESLISATKEGSDIYQINHAGGAAVECDSRTIELIKMGIDYGDASDGRFDITIGKVTDLWDFHAEDASVPDAAAIKEALSAVDYKQIKIEMNTVTMENPQGEINLGGIGKGYVADRVTEYLVDAGVSDGVVNFGGNIVTIGDKAGQNFKIGIEKPFSDQGEIVGYVTVKDATVVTSGIYERYIEENGKIYHHILDVNTGYSVDTDVVSVSLVSELGNSARCDAMSTICLILGVEEGMKYIESVDGVEAIFIDADGKITMTEGMDCFTQE